MLTGGLHRKIERALEQGSGPGGGGGGLGRLLLGIMKNLRAWLDLLRIASAGPE